MLTEIYYFVTNKQFWSQVRARLLAKMLFSELRSLVTIYSYTSTTMYHISILLLLLSLGRRLARSQLSTVTTCKYGRQAKECSQSTHSNGVVSAASQFREEFSKRISIDDHAKSSDSTYSALVFTGF